MHFPRVLVMGATGRIGAILRRFWPDPQENTAHETRVLWQTRHNPPEKTLNWLHLDPLGDPAGLRRAVQSCEVVLCLAGVTQAAVQAGTGQMADNISLAEAAVQAAARTGAKNGARVFLASSAAVYGNQTGVLTESCALTPLTDYGRAKATMETRATQLGAELGVPVCSLRIGNIAGIDAILGGWRPGFRLDQFADGRTPRRSYIGGQTLARVLGDLLRADALPAVLNVATPGMIEMGALLDAAGLAWQTQPAPDSAIAGICLSTLALERFTSLTGIEGRAPEMVRQWRLSEPVLKG